MKRNFLFVFTWIYVSSFAQNYNLLTDLDSSLQETSGLLYLNNTIITHNDSGNTNQLFEIDPSDGTISRTITISNATNSDWEDVAYDDTYIYIADIGNNQGTRTDLKIYRILRSDYFANTTVMGEVINFSYSDQVDFSPSPFSTNFDAEALIHCNNKLYIFTKNWIDATTNIYELSDTPGTHTATLVDTFDSEGLITGSTYNTTNGEIMLVGYDGMGSFLIQLNGFNSGLFSNGTIQKTSLNVPMNYSTQTEGVASTSSNEYLISAEELSGNSQGLYSFNTSTLSNTEIENRVLNFHPNPASKEIKLNQENCATNIYSLKGELVLNSKVSAIDISQLEKAIYIIKIKSVDGGFLISRLVID